MADQGPLTRWLAEMTGSSLEARWILEESEARWRSRPSHWAANPVAEVALELARRRAGGEPLQYVFGHWAFRRLELVVDHRALIPRPETEVVVEVALAEARHRRARLVADLGTGTGAIALALADELAPACPGAEVLAVEVDEGALELAAENLGVLSGTGRPHLPVNLLAGSFFEALPAAARRSVDLVVANPPYVSASEWEALDPEVRCFEPRRALVAPDGPEGTPGMGAICEILSASRQWLSPRGVVVIEVAPHQAAPAAAFAASRGLGDVEVHRDLAGRDRVLVAGR